MRHAQQAGVQHARQYVKNALPNFTDASVLRVSLGHKISGNVPIASPTEGILHVARNDWASLKRVIAFHRCNPIGLDGVKVGNSAVNAANKTNVSS
jgi:hypothetical protein